MSMTEPYSVLLDANSDETFRILKNKSWDAHLDHLGFPKMYESSLCSDKCGRKRIAMDPSKGGDRRVTGDWLGEAGAVTSAASKKPKQIANSVSAAAMP